MADKDTTLINFIWKNIPNMILVEVEMGLTLQRRVMDVVGKSTLLMMLTGTHSEAASYEFKTIKASQLAAIRKTKHETTCTIKRSITCG
ncbi:hypothetical protein YC2023_115153 [Brassica napus]